MRRSRVPASTEGRRWPGATRAYAASAATRLALRLGGAALGDRELRFEIARLRCEVAPARLELEEHGLRGLAGEPQIAARRVVAEPLGRHGRDPRVEQRLERDDGELVDEVLRPAAGEDRQAAETGLARPLQQLEPCGRIRGEDRRRARAERGSDCPLGARGHVERAEHELCPLLGKRPGRGRKPFLLRENALHCERPLAGEPGTLREVLALARRLAGAECRLVRRPFELDGIAVSRLGRGERGALAAKPFVECRGRFAPEREPLCAALQAVEGGERSFAPAGRVRELVLGPRAVGEEPFQAPLDAAADECRLRAP